MTQENVAQTLVVIENYTSQDVKTHLNLLFKKNKTRINKKDCPKLLSGQSFL